MTLSRVILLSMTLTIFQNWYGLTHSDAAWLVAKQGAAVEQRQKRSSSTTATRQAERVGEPDSATGVSKRTPRPFKPSEKIAPDQAVAFPVDT